MIKMRPVTFSAGIILVVAILTAALALIPQACVAADAAAAPFSEDHSGETEAKSESKTDDGGKDKRIVAVLFSVSKTENALKQFSDIPNIDLLEVSGEPMIKHIYTALRRSKYIDEIVVVAAPEVAEALRLDENPAASFIEDEGDAAKSVEFGIDRVREGDLLIFLPSDLVLVTFEGIDRLIERALQEKDVDLFFPIISREACEEKYPEEERSYAHFKEGTYTGGHIEILRPTIFLENAEEVEAEKGKLYDLYYMRKDTLGIVRFLGIKLTLKYIFGILSPSEVEQHLFDEYSVVAKTLYWDDPDFSTDLSEPKDIEMIQRELDRRREN
jgi:hypothetical protein